MTSPWAVVLLLGTQGLDASGLRHSAPLSQQVRLEISSERQTYYVGELVRFTLVARNFSQSPVTAYLALDPVSGHTDIEFRCSEAPFAKISDLARPDFHSSGGRKTLQAGSEVAVDVGLSLSGLRPGERRFLLDRPGRCEFRARYQDTPMDPNGVLESNAVSVDVVAAPPIEGGAPPAYTVDLASVAQFRAVRHHLTPEVTRAAAEYIDLFPAGRYPSEVRAGLRRSVSYRVRTGVATPDERALYDRLSSDVTAPLLTVDASPSRLWPPNQKLVHVRVTATVSDDSDASPGIKLVSITCDDGCQPAEDVAGAAVGTDDRDFELRAKRRGSGAGRTYTIRYSASDAAGNTTTAEAVVRVAHDQAP